MHRRLLRLPEKLKAEASPAQARSKPRFSHGVWSLLSSIVGLLTVCAVAEASQCKLLIGSFAASSVLLYGACDSPLAQPRNVVGGHVLAALVAVLVGMFLGSGYLAIALAVGLAIFLMYWSHTLHPPAGATALIAVQAHATITFVFVPVLAGALILLAVALFTNNIVNHRRYPQHWW